MQIFVCMRSSLAVWALLQKYKYYCVGYSHKEWMLTNYKTSL